MGFGPQFVDLDADGDDDLISGSYWPGHIYLFERTAPGTFAAGRELVGADGEKVHAGKRWKTPKEPDQDSLAAAPHLVDFDGDGDFDLLVGNIEGRVVLIENEGTRTKPRWSTARRYVEAAGKPVKVDADAGPTTADWDGDGRFDLIVGANDGAVWFYRNVGTKTRPVFEAGRTLIAPFMGKGVQWPLVSETPERHGMRAKVFVVDYDGDGTLDLLVGDYHVRRHPAPELTPTQRAERDRIKAELKKASRILGELMESPDARSADGKKRLIAAETRYMTLTQKLAPFKPKSRSVGWVWLYRGKAR